MRAKPNVLLITSDQHRKDSLGVYANGFPARTPNLDAIAADGVVFDRAYTPHATCTPARASILTGQYASRHGAYTIGTALDWGCCKVTDSFNAAGYATHAVGKMHFRPVSTEGEYESLPRITDWDFWRHTREPYYGFRRLDLLNRHACEALASGMHYGVWLRDKHGLSEEQLKAYFNGLPLGRWEMPRRYHQSVYVAEKTIEAIERAAAAATPEPFFIWASFPDPHAPMVAPAPYDTMFNPDELDSLPYREGEFDDKPPFYQMLYDAPQPKALPFSDRIGLPSAYSCKSREPGQIRQGLAIHHGMVALMDEEIGRIVDALKRRGLYDNTIILFTTDHGDTLGNHGFWGKGFPAYEEVFNIPLLIKNAGPKRQAPRRSGNLCSLVDIAPTILELCGLPVPAAMQGRSLAPELDGGDAVGPDYALIENRLVEQGFYQKILVGRRFKLVVYQDYPGGELYDLESDRHQYVNLWDSAAFRDEKLRMLRALATFGDPSRGSVPAATEEELLALIFARMKAEGPVQKRTSFS